MKPNRKIHIAGMLTGALLLISAGLGLSAAMDHITLNVSLASNPGLTSIINNLVLCAAVAGIIGLLLLTVSLVLFIRGSRVRPALQTPASNPPGNTLS